MKGRSGKTVAALIGATLLAQQSMAAPARAQPGFESGLRRAVAITGRPPERLRLADRMAYYKVPGVSVAIMEDCRIVFTGGYGVTSAGGKPIGPDTLFQAASISKPVAALGALRLVDRKLLDLDADVRTTLKGWRLPESSLMADHPVTLRGLLSHGAGLSVSGFKGYDAGAPLPTIVQILDGAAPANSGPVTVAMTPGSKWQYSGGGYTLAQLMMIEAAGQPFPALMKHWVLDPAGMKESSFDQPPGRDRAGRAAIAHLGDGSPVPGGWHVYPEMAAAGLWTTPGDLLRFANAVIQADRGAPNAIIRQATARQMLTAQIGNWGLGPELNAQGKPREFSHGGANLGFRSQLNAFPDTCQGAAVMTNGANGTQLANEIMRAIADDRHWPDPMASQQRDVVALTPAIVARFVGAYHLKGTPTIRFRIQAGADGALVFIDPVGAHHAMLPGSADSLFSPDSDLRAEFDPATGRYDFGFGDAVSETVRDEE